MEDNETLTVAEAIAEINMLINRLDANSSRSCEALNMGAAALAVSDCNIEEHYASDILLINYQDLIHSINMLNTGEELDAHEKLTQFLYCVVKLGENAKRAGGQQ